MPTGSFGEHKIENLVYRAVQQQLRVMILKVILPPKWHQGHFISSGVINKETINVKELIKPNNSDDARKVQRIQSHRI